MDNWQIKYILDVFNGNKSVLFVYLMKTKKSLLKAFDL